ncbi:ABC transporter ATP-binding protein [Caldovatus sediminis]|jgi:branched-chain amino acid transport system ATP-binding protein|uniref:ABC transporter ATP-binding protein n=1 Tax=Caldovatus sediminis TaxID=2041189 RepID=A0A8J3EBD4_9PROT|nr:ABC transporter ATP-binding protein [Caldovatus sediminis]GGG35945.1 ABC transporter ATP-binding protein [Caldovatus sediminis]
MSLLEVRGAVGGYGEADILHGADLTVAAGQVVVVIGPNGAGKSTLLKAVAGLVPLRAGRVVFDGSDITNRPAEELVGRGLAYVPQERNVFPSLTVEENLAMGAFVRPSATAAGLERVYALLPDLLPRRRVPAGSLSGGQRQMLAIGRALMLEPRLVMLDEPTAGLSPRFCAMIFGKIREIAASGAAVLMVEQNARPALAVADRGVVLAMGRNRAEDTGAALLANPEIGRLFLGG